MTEICARLDGVPLAIELAAARVRALSLAEILDSLHDRFRLLTGGSRTAVRRQQTLRASVDWSHALLSEPERVLFRRLAVYQGGFDLDAAQTVAGGADMQRFQVLDLLSLLVDKSLVVADNAGGATRYRLWRRCANTPRRNSASPARPTPCAPVTGNYTSMAALLDAPAGNHYERLLEQAELEIDNLRAAFAWSLENCGIELALTLASSLQPLWQARGRIREGLAWFDAALADHDAQHSGVAAAVRARALADRAVLATWMGEPDTQDQAQQALAIAREVDDPAPLARALTACGVTAAVSGEPAGPYFAEAIGMARELNDRWRLSQILTWQATAVTNAGDPIATRAPAEEGRDLAESIGDRYGSRRCRFYLGWGQVFQGDLVGAAAQFAELVVEAKAAHDVLIESQSLAMQGLVLAYQGHTSAARAAADAGIHAAAEVGGLFTAMGYAALAVASLAAGDAATAHGAIEAWPLLSARPQAEAVRRAWNAQAALASGDLVTARREADEAVTMATSYYLSVALSARARVAIAQGEPEEAERDAHDALALAATSGAYLLIPDIFECLAGSATVFAITVAPQRIPRRMSCPWRAGTTRVVRRKGRARTMDPSGEEL